MNTRTEQDNDIKIYSYQELETMMRILETPKKSNTYVPFSIHEINEELKRRQNS